MSSLILYRTARVALGCMVFASLSLANLNADLPQNCARCNAANCRATVCRLVAEEKKVTVTQWGCQTAEFCVPGPSSPLARHCETIGDNNAAEGSVESPCSRPKKWTWTEWCPNPSAKVFQKSKLMKRTLTKTIPSYKWVVEPVCPECLPHTKSAQVPVGVVIPPRPELPAGVIYLAAGEADSEVTDRSPPVSQMVPKPTRGD